MRAVAADDALGDADAGAIDEDARHAMRGLPPWRSPPPPDSALETSQATAVPPIAAATASALAALRSNTATFAPLAASASAVALPSPEPPPVTIAATPAIFMLALLVASARFHPRR